MTARPPDPARGVFETMLVRDGRPMELKRHLERMAASLVALFGRTLPTGTQVLVLERARAVRLGRLRLTVAPAADGRLVADVRATPIPETVAFPSFEQAVELAPTLVEGGLGSHKWADRDLLAEAEAAAGPAAVPLLLDADESVLEASRANVFVVHDGALTTPPADGRILPGVTRRRTLELAAALALEAHEATLSLDRLLEADEVFLTGSVRGVEPVRALGGRRWGEGSLVPLLADQLRRRRDDARIAKAVG